MIIVTGTGRSGTTWMQWYLSQHPDIQIHGQDPPELTLEKLHSTLETVLHATRTATTKNQDPSIKHYQAPHYAGTTVQAAHAATLNLAETVLFGPAHRKLRNGLKALDAHSQKRTAAIKAFWPTAKFVTCIRHPRTSYESARNTFCPNLNLDAYLQAWTHQVVEGELKGVLYVVDHANTNPEQTAKLVEHLETEEHTLMTAFRQAGRVVHRVIPHEKRTFCLKDETWSEALERAPVVRDYIQRLRL